MEKSRTLVLIATMRSLTTGCPDPTHLRAQLRQETTTSASDRARLSPMHGCPETGEHDSFLVSHRVSRIPLLEGRETVAGTTAIPRLCTSQHHWPGPQRESDCAEAAGLGADLVFTDKLSGSARTRRPGLAAMLDYARRRHRCGDGNQSITPLVAEVIRTIAELGERRILLRALREGIDNRYTHRASRSRSSNRGCAAEGGGGRSR